MGQSVSAPRAHPDLTDFLNFPKEALDSLWTSYNLLGEGWGLNVDEMIAIFNGAKFVSSNYKFTDDQLRALFKAFDTDNNGLIDALELFVTIALASGMDTIDKIHFAFCAYDFDNAGSLSFDEATLLLRSVVQGLCKVSPSNVIFTSPSATEVERFTGLVFQHANKEAGSRTGSRVTTAEFRSYCSAHPVTSSWLKAVAQFPSDTAAPKDLAAELGDPSVVLGPAASQVPSQARHPFKSASVIAEEDYLTIAAIKAAEEAEAAKPKNSDILGGRAEEEEDEDEESQEARRAAEAAALAAAAANDPDAPVLPPWAKTVELLRPEDATDEARRDPPEDQFEPLWMTGVNTARSGEIGAPAPPLMHRCVRYASMALPPALDAAAEGEEEVTPVAPPTEILGSTAAQVFVMRKEEEAGWTQRLYTQHGSAVTCLDVHHGRSLLVTAEQSPARVVLWNLASMAVLTTIPTKHGVRFVDINEAGTLLLVVTADLASTVTMYEIPSGKVVFARPLLLGPRVVKDCIADVRFTGTSAMFAVGSALQGVTFFVEEGGSFMGGDGMKLYEERSGLYQAVGRPAVGAAITELCRFEGQDELVAGTDKGQILVWHGRTVAQLIEAHRTAVRALDFNRSTLTLVSGGEDGVINIYQLAAHVPPAIVKGKRAPQIVAERLLELSATFDILRHDLRSYSIRSLCLSPDSRRALVTTAASEVMELALFITPPTADEIAEAEAIAEAENAARAEAEAAAAAAREAAIAAGEEPTEQAQGEEVPFVSAVPSLERFLGDDVHKGPILSAHFAATIGAPAAVTSVCRVPAGGFATCGADGTVRWWQGVGGSEETGASVYTTAKVATMDSGCSAVDASAAHLAVALTGSPNKERVGSIHLFSLPDMQFVAQFSEPTQAITTLKFSPEGNLLVAASRDGVLYVYQSVEGAWSHKGVCGANTVQVDTFATKLDFSADGLYVRCYFPQSQVYRLYDVSGPAFGRDLTDLTAVAAPPAKKAVAEDGEEGEGAPAEEDPAASGPPLDLLRSLTWASHSCAHHWDTKGALSHLLPGATDRYNHLLLTATEGGAVAVERVPQPKYASKKQQLDTSKLVTFTAHLGGVSALAFIDEGARLVTAGAQDGTLRVWKVLYDTDEFEPDPEFTDAPAAAAEEEEGEEDEAGKAAKLEAVYDSAEDEDLLDQHRMRDHLSRDNVRKRRTLQAQKEAAARAAEEAAEAAAYAAAQAAAAAAEAGADGSSLAGSAAESPAAPAKEGPEPDLEIDLYSGTKWAASLGVPRDEFASEAARALSAPPALVPSDELELSWLYGCSSRHTRAAVHYSKEGTIVYPAGCVGVVLEKVAGTQLHAMPHCDEITALDVHPYAGLAVSAHKGNGRIHASIWSTADGSIRRNLDCGAVNGVSAVRFSPDAAYIALTCQDPDHTLLVFNTADGRLCASHRNGPKKPLCLAFSLGESTTAVRIVQGGALHFKFLTFYAGRSAIVAKTGAYGADVKKSNVNCVSALPLQPGADGAESSGNEFLLGMADGTIGVVAKGESRASAFTPAVKGPVTAMYVVKLKEGTADEPPAYKVVVGGTNGLLKVLDQELQPLSEWNLYINPYGLLPLGRVRGFKSLCVDKLNRKILYATAGGEVGEVDLLTGADVNKGPLVHGHFRDQLHALCSHPLRQECITAGDDKTLRVWHLDTHQMATSIDLPDIAHCATYSPNGHLVVVGLGGEVAGHGRSPRPLRGRIVVVSYLQGALRLVHTAGDAQDTISAVLFTPDGSKLLAASLDGNVYIYDALNNFQLMMALTGQHKEGIRSMDISESGQFVTTCGEYNEFFVWDLSTAAVVGPKDRFEALAATGLDWSVRQAPFGLNSVGVFPEYSDPADTLTLSQSKDHKLLAVGDSFGSLKLFRNPATEYFAPHKRYVCHSPGGVSKVAFTVKDEFLLSTGRYDRLLAQWRVVKCADLPDPKAPPKESDVTVSGGFVPDEDYAATYTIRGVSFAEEATVDTEGLSAIRAQLSAIVGTGTSSPASAASAQPRAAFFGQGDLLTASGRLPVLLDVSGDGSQKVLFPPASADGISGPYANPNLQQVSAFAVTPSGKFAAIGHAADEEGYGRFRLVTAPSGQLVSELSSEVPGGVLSVSFSEDGTTCACLGGDAQHSLHVFRTFTGTWEDATHLATAQVSAGAISLLGFIPTQASAAALAALTAAHAPPPAPESGAAAGQETETAPVPPPSAAAPQPPQYHLVTGGAGHIKFWRIVGQNLHSTCGDYGADVMNKPVFTALVACLGGAYFRAQVVAGDSEGALHFWRGGKKVHKIPHHHTSVTALKAFGSFSASAPPSLATRRIVTSTSNLVQAASGFVSGSNDKLVVWSTEAVEAVPTHSFPVQQLLSACGWSSSIYLSSKLNSSNFITAIDTDPTCARLAVSFSSSAIVTVAKDSRTVQKVAEGHARAAVVTAVVAHPTEPGTVLTLASDGTLRLWDVSGSSVVGAGGEWAEAKPALVGALQLQHPPTAAVFLNATTLLVAVSGADTNGSSGSIFVVTLQHNAPNEFFHGQDCRYHLTIASRLHNVGSGSLLQLRLSPGFRYLSAACSDGCAYLFRLEGVDAQGNLSLPAPSAVEDGKGDDLAENAFVPLGFLLAHPSGAPVAGVDFSADERFARTFSENFARINGKVEVNFFELGGSSGGSAEGGDEGNRVHAGVKVQDSAALTELKSVAWATVSSPAASEVRGVNYATRVVAEGENAGAVATVLRPAQVSSVSTTAAAAATGGSQLVCAAYEDGSVGVYRYPVYSCVRERTNEKLVADLNVHSAGVTLSTFTAPDAKGAQRLVTVSQGDGSLMVWDIQA